MGEAKKAIKRKYERSEKGKQWILISEEKEFIKDVDDFMEYSKPLKQLGGIEKTERKGTTVYHTSIGPDRTRKYVWEWEY